MNQYSLLYTVHGTDSALLPYMICAHMDVVPVRPMNWEESPFNGTIKDGVLYGRGTLDDKGALMVSRQGTSEEVLDRPTFDSCACHLIIVLPFSFQAAMEALESLLTRGFQPKRSFYLAFGHDEEVR